MRLLRLSAVLSLALLLWWQPARAEEGILVLRVADAHYHPVDGLVLSTQGDGSTSPPTDTAGKTRLRLAPQTKSGQWVSLSLQIARQPSGVEWVMISPWDWRARVPAFENENENFVPIVVVKKADRAMLESGDALRAITASLLAAQSPKAGEKELSEAQRQQVLGEQAARFGLSPQEVDQAIRACGEKASDPFEKDWRRCMRSATGRRRLSWRGHCKCVSRS